MFKENDPQTILDKKGSEYLKTGVTLPTTPSISHSMSQPPLPPMLISRGFTSFVLSSNIDRGDGGGISKHNRERVCHSCDCSKSKTIIF